MKSKNRTIILAESAGFCFGVNRAVDLVYSLVEQGEKVCTMGPIIHNQQVVDDLASKGVKIIDNISDCPEGYKIVIRTHGIEKEEFQKIVLSEKPFVDATCPFVEKIHKIVSDLSEETVVFIAGDSNHPEVKGIRSCCNGKSFVFKDASELENIHKNSEILPEDRIVCVCQTTFPIKEWEKCSKLLSKLYTNSEIYDTICNATTRRQSEAEELSKKCDAMIVIGGRHSSNTCKLRDVSSKSCDSFLIETASELKEIDFTTYNVIGVTAGASTPSAIIMEVYKLMSEEIKEEIIETTSADGEMSFAQMLEEQEKKNKDNGGRVVKGIVSSITPTEVYVEVPGRKQTGVISLRDLSSEPVERPEDVVSIGEELDLVVIKKDDEDGVIKLSKKQFDSIKGWDEVKEAYDNGAVLDGKVTRISKKDGRVKGVLVSVSSGARIFVPASLSGVPRNGDINAIYGEDVQFKVIQIKEENRQAVGSIKAVKDATRKEKEAEIWDTLEIGQTMSGTVKSLTSYGAFVDIGGIDGMIHISELSWSRIKHPSDVVSIGDQVEVTIKDFDEESHKISLGYKKIEDNPWEILKRDYPVGSAAECEVVSFAEFGAFATIIPGIEGLIHISQISWERVEKPEDALKIGQKVECKVIDVDYDKKRVSLSIKELLEKPEGYEELSVEDDAPVEETTVEEAPVEETVAEEAPVEETAVEEVVETPVEEATEE